MGELYSSVLVPTKEQIEQAQTLKELATLVMNGTNVCRVLKHNEKAHNQTAMAIEKFKQCMEVTGKEELQNFVETFPHWDILLNRVDELFPEINLEAAVQ